MSNERHLAIELGKLYRRDLEGDYSLSVPDVVDAFLAGAEMPTESKSEFRRIALGHDQPASPSSQRELVRE